uniref:3-hydroxyisobutyryl-CoA hydrolase n=1 Tax=Chromera velia CCMP2878 TaxID=1169474 RepID=A0A0G4GN54_9ALVE|eukprot:Cvel_22632.t1-p1 / transcript=Cvel_22632.t1 / gene=Cvel_22632 / organism=Chromera_velia_CCMP2878 / gene_product=3-hydroxyisobutyryl-CoA hydrolase, mitochondrial, putative / transcript_product=3-hydroxyisobutyryl-CoA hydrolase, mitochondrial, putative / location=Cvel_scaffold2245:1562-7332(-) / protein_length=426 / sequence_SO=supercontig / SO=protein_coding / is_pseudo=false
MSVLFCRSLSPFFSRLPAAPPSLSMERLQRIGNHVPAQRSTRLFASSVAAAFGGASSSPEEAAIHSGELQIDHFKANGLVKLTLNRPKGLNALTTDQVTCLCEYLPILDASPECSAVLVVGAGEKAFCAGGDIKTLSQGTAAEVSNFFSKEYLMDLRTSEMKKPYACVWNGIVMGGGVGISNHGRFRIATEKTMWAMPETGIGLFPDVGASFLLPRLPRHVGMYLGLTGARLSGSDVLRLGLATHFVPSSQIGQMIEVLQTENGMEMEKVLQRFAVKSFQEAEAISPRSLSDETIKDIDQILAGHGDLKAMMKAMRTAGETSEFWKKTVATIEKKCPTSCGIVFRQIAEGKQKSLAECLKMEFKIATACAAYSPHNFREGVRVTLVDKGDTPKWDPASIEELTDEHIDKYFACPDGEPLESFVSLS